MWLLLVAPEPVPSPLDVYLHNDPTTWFDVWGPTLIGFVGSLLVAGAAIIGVIIGANKNAKAIIDAETHRHEHDIDQSNQVWLRDTKSAAYFRLIDSLSRCEDAVAQYAWFARNATPNAVPYAYAPVNSALLDLHMDRWNESSQLFRFTISTVRAIGRSEIADLARQALDHVSDALDEVIDGIDAADSVPFDHTVAGQSKLDVANEMKKQVLSLIRADLKADGPDGSTATATVSLASPPPSPTTPPAAPVQE